MSIQAPRPLPKPETVFIGSDGRLTKDAYDYLASLDVALRGLITMNGTGSVLVANLPSAAKVGAGARAFVTNATSTTFHSTVAGGGANKVPVVSDGTNWLIG